MANRGPKEVKNWVSLCLSVVAILISIVSIIHSNNNSSADRRVEVYKEAVVSLETTVFREFAAENGFGDLFVSEVNDEWVKNQLLEACEIKAELGLFDESLADEYWNLVSEIYGPKHSFNSEKYKSLKLELKKKIQ